MDGWIPALVIREVGSACHMPVILSMFITRRTKKCQNTTKSINTIDRQPDR